MTCTDSTVINLLMIMYVRSVRPEVSIIFMAIHKFNLPYTIIDDVWILFCYFVTISLIIK